MRKIPDDMKPGTVHENKFGSFVITKYNNCESVMVRFEKTGSERETHSSMIRKGNVKDLMAPSVFGVGFFGVGKHISSENNKSTKVYSCWFRMMRRCYCKNYQKRFPAYNGCTVNEDWHNFQTFAEWYFNNYPSDGGVYDLDKDIKIDGNKEYGPKTCLFVTEQENVEKALSNHFELKSPEGNIVKGFNIRKFARDNNLGRAHLSAVLRGERKHHKGWTKP